jgi:hypothetical protein
MATQRRRSNNRRQYAKIEGLDDFLRDMGVLDKDIKRAENVFETLAASTVVTLAKSNASSVGRQQALASEDLKTIGAGTVQYGGKAWSFGAEFGSILYGQFPEWRGNKDDAGYFLWPAIREFRDEDMLELWVREVWGAVEHLFTGR